MSDLAETMHTPGPWHAEGPDDFGDYNIKNDDFHVAIGAVVSNLRPMMEVRSNARLIAAAPAMLKALEEIERCIHPSVGGALGAIRKHARAAIAAAKGATP